MPSFKKLSINNLRNITSQSISPGRGINLIYGDNGSGKTSILEAIHLLGLARSFRSAQLKPIVQAGAEECAVFAELDNRLTLGVSKGIRGGGQIHIAGKKADNTAQLAHSLPIQLINSDTFKILEGSPRVRRKYMDWGVFHVEHRFFEYWRQTQRALQHRNSLLRKNAGQAQLAPWTQEFVKNANQIDSYRAAYVSTLLPVLAEVLKGLLPLDEFSLEYDRGWEQGADLLAVLDDNYSRDLRYGYTVNGPQRADLRIKTGSHNAVDILSRGQQKLLVGALKVAQGQLLHTITDKHCVYLADDLPAELDQHSREELCRLFEQHDNQVFITCIDKSALAGCWSRPEENKLFHVKHGKISESDQALQS